MSWLNGGSAVTEEAPAPLALYAVYPSPGERSASVHGRLLPGLLNGRCLLRTVSARGLPLFLAFFFLRRVLYGALAVPPFPAGCRLARGQSLRARRPSGTTDLCGPLPRPDVGLTFGVRSSCATSSWRAVGLLTTGAGDRARAEQCDAGKEHQEVGLLQEEDTEQESVKNPFKESDTGSQEGGALHFDSANQKKRVIHQSSGQDAETEGDANGYDEERWFED
ncbi:hypothetical protein NDU88_006530 [Pleurodeles waltl]|uniref:Uncharacterized protein n=1 Tax=Pleurodeles waltl TaxID=8319 RepID=A0AAV7NUC1_PLEWA|nr:hypothetical protein NDU88_006530 [Pleurodeles waltl]